MTTAKQQAKANSIHDNRVTHRMKPGGPFGFEALCGATKPPDYPLLTTTTETSVNCDDCKRIAAPPSPPEQAPPERIWLSPTTFNYKTRPAPAYVYNEAEREPQDIEYIRADLVRSSSEAVRKAAEEIAEAYQVWVGIGAEPPSIADVAAIITKHLPGVSGGPAEREGMGQ